MLSKLFQLRAAITTTVTYTMSVGASAYNITPSTADSNGTISPNTIQTVAAGGSISFTATPNTGYAINQWLLDGILVQTGGSSYQLNNVTASHTVSVSFSILTYTIQPTTGSNGTVSPSTVQTVIMEVPLHSLQLLMQLSE